MIFFDGFVGVAYKLGVFLFSLLLLQLSREPGLLLLIRIKVLSIPAIFHLRNIWRLPLSRLLSGYLSFDQLTPLKKG